MRPEIPFSIFNLSCAALLICFQGLAASNTALAIESGRDASVSSCIIRRIQEFEAEKQGALDSTPLPESIDPISMSKHQAQADFDVGVQVYHAEFGPEAVQELKKIASQVVDGSLAKDEVEASITKIRDIRAPIKRLRFLFRATSSNHRAPEVLDELTTAVGKLRDVIKRNDSKSAASQAQRVLASLKDKNLEAVDKAIQEFKPSSKKRFDRWMKDTLKETEKILSKGSGTPNEFHTARKNLQAILAVAQSELAQDPDNQSLRQTATFLMHQTELMGDEIGEHEIASLEKGLRYNKDRVEFPSELIQGAAEFISRIKSRQ